MVYLFYLKAILYLKQSILYLNLLIYLINLINPQWVIAAYDLIAPFFLVEHFALSRLGTIASYGSISVSF